MTGFPEAIRTLKSVNNVRLSDYFAILGYADVYTLRRALRKAGDCLFSGREKINTRTGREWKANAKDVFRHLIDRQSGNPQFREAYMDWLYDEFHKKTFVFEESKGKKYRYGLNLPDSVKGTFYAYGLDSLKLSKETGICPFECYRIIIERWNVNWLKCKIDHETKEPYITFDSTRDEVRRCFVELMDLLPSRIKLSDKSAIHLQAYRRAIVEMLDYQQLLDATQAIRSAGKTDGADRSLREAYRHAARLYHPDVNPSGEAVKIMQKVNAYYEKKDVHSINNILNRSKKII